MWDTIAVMVKASHRAVIPFNAVKGLSIVHKSNIKFHIYFYISLYYDAYCNCLISTGSVLIRSLPDLPIVYQWYLVIFPFTDNVLFLYNFYTPAGPLSLVASLVILRSSLLFLQSEIICSIICVVIQLTCLYRLL